MTGHTFGVVPRAPGEERTASRAASPAESGIGSAVAESADLSASPQTVVRQTGLDAVLDQLDSELVGLAPVKTRIREIAALLVVDRLRREHGLASERPSLHMSFTGNPGTGKTTVARRMAEILHRLGYIERGHLVSVTREDLVGQYVGHTAPKTRDALKKAYGGVLFIDEAYYLHRPENERDYGQEAIEILLQAMENERDKLVVILAGYKDRMDEFFGSNPRRILARNHPEKVGGRTLDVAKYAASQAGLPMVSVATNLAHDGLASPVASLEHDGRKGSYGVHIPIAVVVDLDYVRRSPPEQLRSGIGDSLSNLGALADWELAAEDRGDEHRRERQHG